MNSIVDFYQNLKAFEEPFKNYAGLVFYYVFNIVKWSILLTPVASYLAGELVIGFKLAVWYPVARLLWVFAWSYAKTYFFLEKEERKK